MYVAQIVIIGFKLRILESKPVFFYHVPIFVLKEKDIIQILEFENSEH